LYWLFSEPGLVQLEGGVYGLIAIGCGGGHDVSLHALRQVMDIANHLPFPKAKVNMWLRDAQATSKCLPQHKMMMESFRPLGSSAPKTAFHVVISRDTALELVAHFLPEHSQLLTALEMAFCKQTIGAVTTSTLCEQRAVLAAMTTGCLPMPDLIPEFARGPSAAMELRYYGLSHLQRTGTFPHDKYYEAYSITHVFYLRKSLIIMG